MPTAWAEINSDDRVLVTARDDTGAELRVELTRCEALRLIKIFSVLQAVGAILDAPQMPSLATK